jgi:hypothetical protein
MVTLLGIVICLIGLGILIALAIVLAIMLTQSRPDAVAAARQDWLNNRRDEG